jgi:hypothetical protein
MHARPASEEFNPFYERYVNLVPEGDFMQLLTQQLKETTDLFRHVTDGQGEYRYAPDKWSLKEVIGHMSDTERVMSYRLLRIARGDKTPLAGFDENDFVRGASFSLRSVQDLLEEFAAVRKSTLHLLYGLTDEAWKRQGIVKDAGITVLALAAIIAGHELHHRKVLEERYFSTFE